MDNRITSTEQLSRVLSRKTNCLVDDGQSLARIRRAVRSLKPWLLRSAMIASVLAAVLAGAADVKWT